MFPGILACEWPRDNVVVCRGQAEESPGPIRNADPTALKGHVTGIPPQARPPKTDDLHTRCCGIRKLTVEPDLVVVVGRFLGRGCNADRRRAGGKQIDSDRKCRHDAGDRDAPRIAHQHLAG